MAGRSKVPAIGSAGWILEERHQSNDLVSQELEDFGFSVRNELEWLNEHMGDVFANNGQHNLEVFKTPGKLRGKTPRTARKKAAEARQPLASLQAANGQHKPSPAEQSLKNTLQKAATTKTRFQIAEDEHTARVQSPLAKTPIARQLFSKDLASGKENVDSSFHADVFNDSPIQPSATPWSPMHSTQNTVMSSQGDDIFSPPRTQSTQPTQPTQSFRHSIQEADDDRRDTGDSFVSAKEAFASKNASRENLKGKDEDAMDMDEEKTDNSRSDAQDTVIRHDLGDDEDEEMDDIPDFPSPPRVISEQYSISVETHEALDTAHLCAHAPEPKTLFAPDASTTPSGQPPAHFEDASHDDTVVHHDVDEQMDIDDDVRSPSDNSSPVKPLVRKSSLTFASLPAREPLLAKKSMGNRVSRTSHVDPSKTRNSQMGRYTGGKSLGGSQFAQPVDAYDDEMDIDDARPGLQREESETTKIHNKTSTQRLFERINMLKQQNEVPKRVSQNIISSSQPSQAQSFSSTQPKEDIIPFSQASQPSYPSLPATAQVPDEDDDDDWISPVRAAPAKQPARPVFSKSHTAHAPPSPAKHVPSKLISVSNPDLQAATSSTTPAGSPTGKKYMDAPLSASKAKFYSALRAAKEKIIGSSATSAQVKLDALAESPMRPKLHAQDSSDDIFGSPKRIEKPGLFSGLRSPSKESNKSIKPSKTAGMPGSPVKGDGRRTRSSTERQKQKEKETQDSKQRQRAEDKLREMREKEQSKATLHHQKSKGALNKTPSAMSSQSSLRQPAPVATATKTPTTSYQQQQPISRPGTTRTNTASSREQDVDSADEMPPPPPPKSLLPTTKTTKAALREPRKLTKPTSKDALPKVKAPQKIMVNLNSSRYGQAPPPAPRPAANATSKPLPSAPSATAKPSGPAPKATAASSRPASALSGKAVPASRTAPVAKPAAPRIVRPQPQAVEKSKAHPQPPRPDLAAARPVSRMQTVQDANRINVPPVNPAKPPKRPYQGEGDETLHRPAKRPSQQHKMNPITPAPSHHAQFAKGKIPFAEPAHAPQPQPPTIQYPNGDDIKLPEIMTDSEDEDSENEFEQPSWVNTPILRETLASQELMDPEHIFGPIAPLNMEAVFPNKERHKRFRERTSSAFWHNDQITEEDKRKEREARERLVRDGAWTYNPSPRPTPRPAAGPSR
ncbi:hypothetical protein DE146DRAFT_614266 [Phaeosphaeria sp. MPI-PUGE-AT-0046c]|nr:hypothetical protein DE146DRAFT_614266 [Phaeosphaeria sp. MPI-PUGE-AT-0046c]